MITAVEPQIYDPIKFAERFWPDVYFYNKQRDIIYSVVNNDETVVPAGNKLGKDFVAGFIALWFFLTRNPCRVVTTSVDHTQLSAVLWGEIRWFIDEMDDKDGKFPLIVDSLRIRKLVQGKIEPKSYIIGRVSAQEGEGMSGHHVPATGDRIPRTLFIGDEASGIYDKTFEKVESWASRKLIIGNPNPCNNYFFRSVDKGDVLSPTPGKFYTKIIKISATDSPNVRYGLAQEAAGEDPTDEIIIPGVQPWSDYRKALATWDVIKQSIGLWGEFYKGAEVMLYPLEWRNYCKELARRQSKGKQHALAMGVDTAEGGDDTCWSIVNRTGLIYMHAMKTPDTSIIPNTTLGLMREYGIKPGNIGFDSGGGGKEHVDRLRAMGFEVRAIAFGGSTKDVNRFKRMKTKKDRTSGEENKDVYKNRRAEMYGILRNIMNPKNGGFSIPESYTELHRQLKIFPLMYDEEGRMFLPPKNNADPKSKKETLNQILGCSPDETDSLVLATYVMTVKPTKKYAGAL